MSLNEKDYIIFFINQNQKNDSFMSAFREAAEMNKDSNISFAWTYLTKKEKDNHDFMEDSVGERLGYLIEVTE